MKGISLLLFVLVICSVTLRQAHTQTPTPKLDPALENLHVIVGHWTGEVEYKPGPWGPGHKAVIEETGHMILGGHFLQIQDTFKTSSQQTLWIIGYDPANKNYPAAYYSANGHTLSGTITCDGNVWSYTSARKISIGDTQYSVRITSKIAADGMSRLEKAELSPDDTTWLPFDEEKWTKVKLASKR